MKRERGQRPRFVLPAECASHVSQQRFLCRGSRMADEHRAAEGPLALGGQNNGSDHIRDMRNRVRSAPAARQQKDPSRREAEQRQKSTVARTVHGGRPQDRPRHTRRLANHPL